MTNVDESDGASGDATNVDEQSLAWGWVGALAVLVLTVLVLVGAALRTPGAPDCRAYSAAGRLLSCPWYRQFLTNAAVFFTAVTIALVLCGLPVGVLRALARQREE